MIEKYENILNKDEYDKLKYILSNKVKWIFGASSSLNSYSKSLFWYADLNEFEFITKEFFGKIQQIIGTEYSLDRVYANGQTLGQDGMWHQDNNNELEHTFLYYFTKNNDVSIIGETYFKINNELICNIPIPNSAVFFNGNIWHRGMAPRKEMIDMRITIAFKVLKEKKNKTLV
jgi:hypothetical protein